MGKGMLFWCNVASAAVIVVGIMTIYPTVRSVCSLEIADFAANPESDGFAELQSCSNKLAVHVSAWGQQNLGGIVDGAVWWTQIVLIVMMHLKDALCSTAPLLWRALTRLLSLLRVAVAAAGAALADARPLDATLGLAREATIFGSTVARALWSAEKFAVKKAGIAKILIFSVIECVMKEHGTHCMLTDPGFDAAIHPQEVVWVRNVAVSMVKGWRVMQVSCARTPFNSCNKFLFAHVLVIPRCSDECNAQIA